MNATTTEKNLKKQVSQEPKSLGDVLIHLVEETEGDRITLGDLLDALDSRSYGPVLLVIGLVSISPIGAIPGMSLATGSLIILVCCQILAGHSHLWMPKKLLSMEFERERLTESVNRANPWIQRFDRWLKHRLAILTNRPAMYVIALNCIALATTFYPLALLPMGVFLPGCAVSLLALGVTARDGVLVLLGYATTGIAAWVTIAFWPL